MKGANLAQSFTKLALVATGSVSSNPQNVPELLSWFKNDGRYEVVYQEQNLTKPTSAAARAAVFLNFAFDESVDAIAVLRGGEGSADVIPYLHQNAQQLSAISRKMLLGFSDFTAILLYFYKVFGWPCVHGCGALRFMNTKMDTETLNATHQLLLGKKPFRRLPMTPLNRHALELSSLTAPATGGNLSLINISIKDVWEIDCLEKVVILEDVGEKSHVVGRTLKYLQRIDILSSARAIVFGDFLAEPVGCDNASQLVNAGSITRTLKYFAEEVTNVPVFQTNFIGHGQKNMPFLLGHPVTLVGGESASMVME